MAGLLELDVVLKLDCDTELIGALPPAVVVERVMSDVTLDVVA